MEYLENQIQTKKCTKCLCEKDLEGFPIQKHAKDNHSSWCKNCHCEYSKTKYEINSEKKVILCECGKIIFQNYMEKHLKTKIHFKRLSDHEAELMYYNVIESVKLEVF